MTVCFTDGINGAVRLDLDVSEDLYVSSEDFDLGVPTLEGEPGANGAQYGFREIKFTVVIRGSNATAFGVLSALAVEVQREHNWLQVQFDSTLPPGWFTTYKTTPGALDLTQASRDGEPIPGVWLIDVSLTADPLAHGAMESVSAVTVTNNPASAGNPCRYILPALKGDSPTPLSVSIKPSVSWLDFRPMMSLVRHNGTAPGPVVWQAEFFTMGTDATVEASPFFSGASRVSVSFATPDMVTRLSGAAPAAPASGRYKVLLRLARSDNDSTFAVRLMQPFGTGRLSGNGTTAQFTRGASNAAGHAQLLDLGDFSFPMGSDGLGVTQVGSPAPPTIELQVQRLSGTGAAHLDYFVLIPVDTITTAGVTTLSSLFRSIPFPTTRTGIWDADGERFRATEVVGSDPAMVPTPSPEPAGSYLVADPACANVFHLHQQVDAITPTPLMTGGATIDNPDSISATALVSFTYYPAYLWLAAA